jgi:hypothetical protein
MSKMRMYQDAEQELTDAFFNILEVNRHTFKFRVIINEKYEPYHKDSENRKIADLVEQVQIHQLEILRGLNQLRDIFKERNDD